ncbi:MAG: type ISP restriction/modification enzyme [Candidatus Zixiibacteriota bacterium]
MHPVESYLSEIKEIRQTGGGTNEESYYGPLENLLNDIGRKLKPKVRCVSQLTNVGAGEPDFGLYTSDQFQRSKDDLPVKGLPPERGVIEVKGWSDDSFTTATTEQVSKYWKKYGNVLVTNYRDFVLVGRDPDGRPAQLETYRMADDEKNFLRLLAHPRKAAVDQGDRLVEFLRRVMLHTAQLTDPENIAWFLASYAREARARVALAADLPALEGLKRGLEEALGMKFEGDKGEHFFRATLVQTLFYGIFSSWVLWAREHTTAKEKFNWHETSWTLHVPMVKSLFEQIATPTKLKPLGVAEVLDWAGGVLNRVVRKEFFQKFEEEHAVQYFYEPFLKAYDPELRKQLGVWYTPPEIVKYQVERVDHVLRTELGLADGLADERVVVLDPCCGTGAYLVETIRRIHTTLRKKGESALTAQNLKKAAMERIFGFEILPAPFVVSHLQIGLMLRLLGAPLHPDSNERARVYLTNALTGWEPPKDPKNNLPLFPELMEEREAADSVKRDAPIIVILGNPPYNAFAGTSPDEEGGLVDAYKKGLTTPVKDGGWGIKKFNLDDLYVRFFRIAERRIAKSGKGVVCYISNYSWTSEPSFVVLRSHLLRVFDKFWIENMHGNRKISEYAPDGHTSETIFSIPKFSNGIQQGVVISLWVRHANHNDLSGKSAEVLYRDDINTARAADRRQQLLDSLNHKQFDRKYERANPEKANRLSFRPDTVNKDYLSWPTAADISGNKFFAGIAEDRGKALISTDKEPLEERMQLYFDPDVSWAELCSLKTGLTKNVPRFDAEKTRAKITAMEAFDEGCLVRFLMRPFDLQWCYYVPIRPLWREPRPDYWHSYITGDSCLVTRFKATKTPEGPPMTYASSLCDYHLMPPNSSVFPARIASRAKQPKQSQADLVDMFGHDTLAPKTTANLSPTAKAYLSQLGIANPDADGATASLIWMHALAIGYSPAYLTENADGIRQDWPRIPLPVSKQALLESAELGRQVAALLDTEKSVDGVTSGRIREELIDIGIITKVGGGALDPGKGDLDLTAGWGHSGKSGICMPGKGKFDISAIGGKGDSRLGVNTLDIYLNNVAYWADIPQKVWEYYIGGYQVIKKWLSYREKVMLGRGLKVEEAEYVTEMARRIASLVLLQDELDSNYKAVKSDTWLWPLE